MSENDSEPSAPRVAVGGASAYGNKRPPVLMIGLKEGGGLVLWERVVDRAARQWADVPSLPEAEAELRGALDRATKRAPAAAKPRVGRGVGEPVVLVSPNGEVKVDVDQQRFLGGVLTPDARDAVWSLWTEPLPVSEIPRTLPATFQFSTPSEKTSARDGQASTHLESTRFEWESQLENYLLANWDTLPLSTSLEIFGSQYSTTDRGRIDILCKNKDGSAYTVIELKRGLTGDAVVGQVLRYMGWVRANLVKGGQSVSGIIICHDADPKLSTAVSVAPNVDVYTYHVRPAADGALQFSLSKLSKND